MEESEEAQVRRMRSALGRIGEEFLAASGRSSLSRNEKPSESSMTPGKSLHDHDYDGEHLVPLEGVREKRSGCPGDTGNFGFNSFNLLTFALQVFNGILNTINTVNNNNNNDNNNNNNNNDNNGNNVNSNVNEQNSNVESMTSLVVMVRRKRRKREIWKSVENVHCNQAVTQQQMSSVTEDIYSTVSDMVHMSKINMQCVKYVLCTYVQRNHGQYGLQSLGQEALRYESSLRNILYTVSKAGSCSTLFPECT